MLPGYGTTCSVVRHGRASSRPSTSFSLMRQDVDARDEPGHDDLIKVYQICRSTSFSFSSAIASDGLRPFGQALAQFMMVWQR